MTETTRWVSWSRRSVLAVFVAGLTGYLADIAGELVVGRPAVELGYWELASAYAELLLPSAIFSVGVGLLVLPPLTRRLRGIGWESPVTYLLIFVAASVLPDAVLLLLGPLLAGQSSASSADCLGEVNGVLTACGWAVEIQVLAYKATIAAVASFAYFVAVRDRKSERPLSTSRSD